MTRFIPTRLVLPALMAAAVIILTPAGAHATEWLCDSSFQNCRTPLLALIDNETVGIDVGFWFMEDQRYVSHIIARMNAGVPVRLLVDPRANPTYPLNATSLNSFQSAGVPMRKRIAGGILHWKVMIFAGQNVVEFGSANYSDNAFVPVAPYTNYVSETVFFEDDPVVVNSFKTKFDDSWTDTTSFATYANVTGTPTRTYPTFALDPSMNWPPKEDYGARAVKRYNAETQQIDVDMYRVTDQRHTNAIIAAFTQRHVPVRYIGEMLEYRNPDRLWVAWNMDRIYASGIPMKVRASNGENHAKIILLYAQGLTIFGSSNWTSPSSTSQQEHNYFTTKAWMFQWFQDQFNRKWNNSTGNVETQPFAPLPPDKPANVSPASGAVGVATSGVLKWDGGPWAHVYDIYCGTDPNPPLLAADQSLGPDDPSVTPKQYQTFTLPPLAGGTTYYWKIVSKTMAGLTATGPIWSFTTTGTAPPPPPPPAGATTIVLWASSTPTASIHGNWSPLTDSTASGGSALSNADHSQAKISPALASPANYFERSFTAVHGTAYHLWIRMRAQGNSLGNDSIHVQFDNSVDSLGSPTWRIGTSSSAECVLQNGPNDPSDSGWGWTDNGWGGPGSNVFFATDGSQTVRVQQREDGAIVDEIVLSPDTFISSSPGLRDNDTTILTENAGSGSPPPPPPAPAGPGDIVLWSASVAATSVHGNWQATADGSAAGGSGLWNPDAAQAKISPALASPATYWEATFTAPPRTAYHVWVRLRAQNDSLSNDSVHLQFSDSVDGSGAATMQIGSTSSGEFVLQNGPSGAPDHSWGWADNGWGVAGVNVFFAAGGTHTIRVQPREDGAIVDQIVLSPGTYLASPPGPRQNDATILPANSGS